MQNKKVQIKDLGLNQDYNVIWKFQEKYFQHIIDLKMQNRKFKKLQFSDFTSLDSNQYNLTPNYLFFVEHPHVYTIGKSGDIKNMLANEGLLKKIDASYIKTNRGGDITYHGPGQIVVYPVLDLANFSEDVNWYMRSLEEVVIQVIAAFGLKGARSKGETGVWLDVGRPFARKICAMGVKASRWVAMHGLALNVNTDVHYFEYIVPCGIRDKAVTSMQRELGYDINLNEVKKEFKKKFAEVFEVEFTNFDENF